MRFCRSASRPIDTEAEEQEDDTMIVDKEPTSPPHWKCPVKKENKRKQYVEADKRGHPHGMIISYLIEDVKAFAKGLNSLYNWADQPLQEKQRFFDRLYAGNVTWATLFEELQNSLSFFDVLLDIMLLKITFNLA